MARDIDYAATAVRTSIVEKFRLEQLDTMQAIAGDKTIAIHHNGRIAEGTRDDLLAIVRNATSYDDFWALLASKGKRVA
jgi:hypothetical protein